MQQDKARTVILELLRAGGFSLQDIQFQEIAPGDFYVNVQSTDSPLLIGHRGEVLIALQHLLKSLLKAKGFLPEEEHIKFDVNAYRQSQEGQVKALADKYAEQVVSENRTTQLPPMSAYFRRLVHVYIKEKYPDLVTFSEGDGHYRAVVISTPELAKTHQTASDPYLDFEF